MISNCREVNRLILDLLEEMDKEATPREDGCPTGLWWYYGHVRRNDPDAAGPYNTEVLWSQRMAKMLLQRGFSARNECRYPGASSRRCDVVVDIGLAKPLWIEIKGSWPYLWHLEPPKANGAYTKHLKAAADDVEKLEGVGVESASVIAFALIGFDRQNLPVTADALKIIREKTKPHWTESRRCWEITGQVSFRVRCWVWSRRLES